MTPCIQHSLCINTFLTQCGTQENQGLYCNDQCLRPLGHCARCSMRLALCNYARRNETNLWFCLAAIPHSTQCSKTMQTIFFQKLKIIIFIDWTKFLLCVQLSAVMVEVGWWMVDSGSWLVDSGNCLVGWRKLSGGGCKLTSGRWN